MFDQVMPLVPLQRSLGMSSRLAMCVTDLPAPLVGGFAEAVFRRGWSSILPIKSALCVPPLFSTDTALVIDFGWQSTRVTGFFAGHPAGSLECHGIRQLVSLLQQQIRADSVAAENLLFQHCFAAPTADFESTLAAGVAEIEDISSKTRYQVVETWLRTVLAMIRKTLQVLPIDTRLALAKSAVITGGGAELRGLRTRLLSECALTLLPAPVAPSLRSFCGVSLAASRMLEFSQSSHAQLPKEDSLVPAASVPLVHVDDFRQKLQQGRWDDACNLLLAAQGS
ncbi:MAG: hypothetical protein MHM6MM_008235 [Cercozoa sp. M6MM]